MIRLALLAFLLPTLAQAQPQPAVLELMPYMAVTSLCLDAAEDASDAETCIGQGRAICMDADPAQNQTTIGMMFCALAEAESWDRVLNETYTQLIEGMRRVDAQEAENFPQFANRADSLQAAQRAWIVLRDADCTLEYAIWGAGSMRQIAGADCQMRRTAERTIYLRFLGGYMR